MIFYFWLVIVKPMNVIIAGIILGVLTFPSIALLDLWPVKDNWFKAMLEYLYLKYGKE